MRHEDRGPEPGNDELLRRSGALRDVELRRAAELERERAESARTSDAPEVEEER
jgi:hypothetical protein